MDNRYAILFKKASENVVNSYTQWGIVCANVPFKSGGKTKDLPVREYFDENGEDTYIPPALKFDAYDMEFEMAYAGKELASNPFNLSLAYTKIKDFKKWLSGNDGLGSTGAELKIYSSYSTIGRQGCYLLDIDDEETHLQLMQQGGNLYHENVLTFKVKFRVTDPMTDITLTTT